MHRKITRFALAAKVRHATEASRRPPSTSRAQHAACNAVAPTPNPPDLQERRADERADLGWTCWVLCVFMAFEFMFGE